MPLPPRPFTLVCSLCAWKKTILPHSDVLVLGQDWFTHCPQCHAPALEHREASRKEILKTRLEQFLNQ